MSYKVELSFRAFRKLGSLPRDVQEKLKPVISDLAKNPRPSGVTNVKELDKGYRLRAGDHRIVYVVRDDRLIVLVLSVGDRKNVYEAGELAAIRKDLKNWLQGRD